MTSVNTNSFNSSSTRSSTMKDPIEPPPRWQLDLLMEKLRQKSNQLKSFSETAKNIRTAIMDRRTLMDQADKLQMQKTLDTLQQSISINSLQSMVERLEMVSRQLGLKFTPGGTGEEWFISSDMFYLELLIDFNGIVREVKIQHDGKSEQQSCPEMVECLKRNDFPDFTAHLEGLVTIYQLNADKKVKSKAFIALQALESDLLAMSSTYCSNYHHHPNYQQNADNSGNVNGELVVMKSLLGILYPRKGGHPLKLVYYISPYEFLDEMSKSMLTNDLNTIIDRKLGTYATVSIQSSNPHKLQVTTTVSLMKNPDGKSVPRYGVLNATNSTALPACFTVNLSKPIPMCKELLKAVEAITMIPCVPPDQLVTCDPILNLITRHFSNESMDCTSDEGIFVALPDQLHCYYMTETSNLEGHLVSSISFTLASQLPQVIAILRQQHAFNTLIGSCVRVEAKQDDDMTSIVFEVNALSHQNVTVSFQNPLEDSLVTLEFDVRDVSHPQCRLHAIANADIIPTLEEYACKVVQKSMSIPVTLRSVIRRWQTLKVKIEPTHINSPDGNFCVPAFGPNETSSASVTMNQPHHFSSFGGMGTEFYGSYCGAVEGEMRAASTPTTPQTPHTASAATAFPFNVNGQQGNANNVVTSSSQSHTSTSPAYTISPVNAAGQQQGSQAAAASIEELYNYMNPSGPLPFTGSANPNFGAGLPPSANLQAIQMTMLQMQAAVAGATGNSKSAAAAAFSNYMDQLGKRQQQQQQRPRKRKGSTLDTSSPSPSGTTTNPNMTRPSPSPSPKSPRGMPLPSRSPKRRPSECGSDVSDASQGDSRSSTPQTNVTPASAYGYMLSELGVDVPPGMPGSDQSRWNIDITPVTNPGATATGSNPMEAFLASKLLASYGSGLPGDINIKPDPDAIDASDIANLIPKFGAFTQKKQSNVSGKKKQFRSNSDTPPKRSISLDSHSDDSSGHHLSQSLHSLMGNVDPTRPSSGPSASLSAGDFKPLMTPSLSITPVSTNSSTSNNSTVNSLLANMRPGIEIIPLPNHPLNPVIPNSITVTPIMNKGTDKKPKDPNSFGKDPLKKKIKTEDSLGDPAGLLSKKSKLDKKDKKRKQTVDALLAGAMDDVGSGKRPKLMGPFPGNSTSSFLGMEGKSKKLAPGLTMTSTGQLVRKSGSGSQSPNINRSGTTPPLLFSSKSNSPTSNTPKIAGGKPSVSTMQKAVSGSSPTSQSPGPKSMKLKKAAQNLKQSTASRNLSLIMPGVGAAMSSVQIPPLKSLTSEHSAATLLANLQNSSLFVGGNLGNIKSEQLNSLQVAMAMKNAALVGAAAAAAAATGSEYMTSKSLSIQPQGMSASAVRSNNGNGGQSSTGATTPNKKGSGLLAVIDKLKSQQHSTDDIKKDPGMLGKIPTGAMGTDLTIQQQAKKLMQSMVAQNNAAATHLANAGQSGNGAPGTPGSSEYVVKPAAGGLKLTIKGAKPLNKDLKNNLKGMMANKAGVAKKLGLPVLKPSLGANAAKGGSPNFKKSQGASGQSGNGKESPKEKSKTMEEMDLTRKLFMPGAVRSLETGGSFEPPKFDSTFQIPKKSRNNNVSTTSAAAVSTTSMVTSSTGDSGKPEKVLGAPSDNGKVGSSESAGTELTTSPLEEAAPSPVVSSTASIVTKSQEEMKNPFVPEPMQADTSEVQDLSMSTTTTTQLPESTRMEEDEPKVSPEKEEFISPESPDPEPVVPVAGSASEEEPIYKSVPATIPTTPQQEEPQVPSPPVPVAPAEPPESPEEDQLVMDLPDTSSTVTPPVLPTAESTVSSTSPDNEPEPKPVPSPAVDPAFLLPSLPPPPSEQTSMPPPPSPSSAPLDMTVSSPVTLVPHSPSSLTAAVHIVHSPQPSSPAALLAVRSPLLVQSPHTTTSAASSPYPIDDDLMDEALIGNNSATSTSTSGRNKTVG